MTKEEFIIKARRIHKDKYNYSEVKYRNNKIKVIISCPIHGKFEQIPNSHLLGHECRKCGSNKLSTTKTLTTEDFISKAKEVHGNKYDYSKSVYTGKKKKLTITCRKHGDFKQTPASHFINKGCKICNKKDATLKQTIRNWRGYVRKSYLREFYKKETITFRLLGCDWDTLKTHLNNNPYGFKTGDDNLDLDHTIPLKNAKNIIELKKTI